MMTLPPDVREDILPLTIRFSAEHDRSDIDVVGSFRYEDAVFHALCTGHHGSNLP